MLRVYCGGLGLSCCLYSTSVQTGLFNKIKYEKVYFDAEKDKLAILKDDRSLEFHAGGGYYSSVRLPRVGGIFYFILI